MSRSRRWPVLSPVLAAAATAVLAACSSSPATPPPHSSPRGSAPAGQTVPSEGERIGATVGAARELVSAVRARSADPAAAGPVAAAEQAFSVALLKRVAHGTGDVTVSPASLAIALSMLENGAGGATRQQLADALHTGPLSLADQNAGWNALTADWAAAATKGGFQLHSADAVWAQQGFPIRAAFLAALQQGYRAGVWQTDFAGHMPDALAAIDSWCAKQTNGRITKLFDQLDPSTVAVLANAVYFHADWLQPFDSHETSADAFTTAGGSTVSVPTMHDGQLSAPAAVTPGYEAVQLPYKGGRFAALAIMPKGQSLSDFVAGLTPDALATIAGSLHAGEVDLSMPKFTTTSTLDLVSTLRDLGLTDAFGSGADFSPMSPQAVQVGQVVQRDYLSVTEKGTEAAAVTGLGMVATAVMQKQIVHLDHPFLFLVRDTKTGAILFASAVNDPATG